MGFARHARLEDGEAVFELTDSVAHLRDFAVQTVRVREDEPVGARAATLLNCTYTRSMRSGRGALEKEEKGGDGGKGKGKGKGKGGQTRGGVGRRTSCPGRW